MSLLAFTSKCDHTSLSPTPPGHVRTVLISKHCTQLYTWPSGSLRGHPGPGTQDKSKQTKLLVQGASQPHSQASAIWSQASHAGSFLTGLARF